MDDQLSARLSIYELTRQQLADWLEQCGEKTFRTEQIWDWLYGKRVTAFQQMTNLSQALTAKLAAAFTIQTIDEAMSQQAADGTVKYLFRLADGQLIETVLMRHDYGLSVCVTSQVGCNIGCSFCASGLLRKTRDLTSGEMVEQLLSIQRRLDESAGKERISHVVVMGIGEPFDNFEAVVRFLHIINDGTGLAIGARHITVSTSGIVPKICAFADIDWQVNLAISLHAATDTLRSQIMKINRVYPIDKLMAAVDYYVQRTNRRVTFEYIMLSGVNDRQEDALKLAELLRARRRLVYVNLIPYNPVEEHDLYHRSSNAAVSAFQAVLTKHGIGAAVRREFGTDIDAACGQLRSKQMQKERRHAAPIAARRRPSLKRGSVH
ncbi:MAG: 23S rRNA (adenine(2503)-C(2))-methyltransferase RlmN [Sporolactobacillus sp.]